MPAPARRRKIRLIHTSDTHLGDDWNPDAAARALSAVVDGVHRLAGDALLIAGDVFDHARIPDAVLEFFVAEMARAAVPAIILPGNHDLYDAASLYHRRPFAAAPDNLHIISGTRGATVSLPDLTLDIWGRAMDCHTPAFRPLQGIPARRNGNGIGNGDGGNDGSSRDSSSSNSGNGSSVGGNERWLVAMAHGHFHYPDDTEERSSPIRPHEIAAAACDYLALGHWERFEDVSQNGVTAYYSGSPMGASPARGQVAVNVIDLDGQAATPVSVTQARLPLPAKSRIPGR